MGVGALVVKIREKSARVDHFQNPHGMREDMQEDRQHQASQVYNYQIFDYFSGDGSWLWHILRDEIVQSDEGYHKGNQKNIVHS